MSHPFDIHAGGTETRPQRDRLGRAEIRKALQAPDIQKALVRDGFVPDGRPPAEFAQFVKSESERFGRVTRNIKVD